MSIQNPYGVIETYFDGVRSQIRWEFEIKSQSLEDNTTTIYWELIYSGVTATFNKPDRKWTVSIENQWYNGTVNLLGGTTYQTLATGTTTIKHNADGTKTFSAAFNQEINTTGVTGSIGTVSGGDTFALPELNRAPKLLSAPDFNDEQTTLAITYNVPAIASTTSLQACIGFLDDTDGIPYRDINIAAGADNIVLSADDIAILRSMLDVGYTELTVRFYIKGVVDGETYKSSLYRVLTFINFEPVITKVILRDTDERTTRVTGAPESIFVKGKSNISYNVTAQARKGASIGSITAYCGDNKQTSFIGSFEDIESKEFKFYVTDTRGHQTLLQMQPTFFIPYFNPTANLSTDIMTREGNLTFTVKGKFYKGDFGLISNNLELEYALIDNEGNFIFNNGGEGSGWVKEGVLSEASFTGKNYTYSVDSEGNYTYTKTLTGIDTLKTYTLEVNVFDEIVQEYKVSTLVSVTPLFDWNKKNFHHHTDVVIDGKLTVNYNTFGEQKILWAGSSVMGGSDVAQLTELVTDQTNGIMLVFSLVTDGVPQNVSLNTFFVSKMEVNLLTGAPHTFLMGINSGFSVFGAKYLYIYNNRITGQATNDAAGSNNGINYNNRRFILRYVLGV